MNILFKSCSIIAKNAAFFVILTAIAAFFYPDAFTWIKGSVQALVLGFIMLTMGMTLSYDDYKILSKRPLDIFIGALAQYTIMPLAAWALVHLFELPKGIAVGLLLVGTCPGGVSSNIMTYLAKGDVAFSVGMTTVSTLLSPIMTPLLMLWLTGENIDVNAWGMFKSILIVTLIPVCVGSILNITLGKKHSYKKAMKIMPALSVCGLALIVGSVTSIHGKLFFTSAITIFCAIALHNTLGYIGGYIAAKSCSMTIAQRKTLAIEVGCQNAGLATNLASAHFHTLPEAAMATAVACVYHSISGTILANIFAKIRNK